MIPLFGLGFLIALIIVFFHAFVKVGTTKIYKVCYFDLAFDIEHAKSEAELYDLRHAVKYLYNTYYQTEKDAYTDMRELNNLIDKKLEKPKDSLKLQKVV